MSAKDYNPQDVLGLEAKHITYVVDQQGGNHDALIVKEVVHLKDNRRVNNLRVVEDYKRPFWITHKGMQNHREKKDYEYAKNCQKYTTTQLELPKAVARALNDYSMGPNPRLRQLSRSPYLYGTDVSSTCYLKYDYRSRYPEQISLNRVAGGDIETNVHSTAEEIICMSVSHKDKAVLYYWKDWVADVVDPVGTTIAEADLLIGDLLRSRNITLEVYVVDTPAEVVLGCFKKLHEWKPDFFSFWNMDFDISKIIRELERAGIDPKYVFSDPDLPERFKYFDYRRGPAQKVTASGKTMSINIEDRWNWVTHPASFQCIDAMTVYRNTRLANGKDSSYALDAILTKELSETHTAVINSQEDFDKVAEPIKKLREKHRGGFVYVYQNDTLIGHNELPTTWAPGDIIKIDVDYRKLKFPETDHLSGLRWHEVMQEKHKVRYGIYNIVDSIRLEQIDEKTNDLASSITMYSKYSDYKNFNSNPKRLCDDMHFWYLNRPDGERVIGSSSDQMADDLDVHVVGADDWIITLPSYMAAPKGLKCVKDFPDYSTLIFTHVADLD
jgi:hypothetical protein